MIDSFAPVDPSLIDVRLPEHDGYPEHLAADDTPSNLFAACGSAGRKFPQSLWIEPGPDFRNWKEKARQNDELKTWGYNYCDRFTDQSPTHECTGHSHRVNMEAARNRHLGIIFPDGPKKDFRYPESAAHGSAWISVMSMYAIANPGQWGGAAISQLLDISCRTGALPDKIQPREYGFKHTLQGTAGKGNSNQSSGPWITERQFPDGWQETAKWFRSDEVIVPDTWEQMMCLLLHSMIFSVGRNGHAVPYAGINFASEAIPYIDSYNVIRYDSFSLSRSAFRGGYAIATMTMPSDRFKPAG